MDRDVIWSLTPFRFNPWMEFSKPTVYQLYDLERTLYYQEFLRETLKSIYEDGVNVIGALGWSFVCVISLTCPFPFRTAMLTSGHRDNDEFFSYLQQYVKQTGLPHYVHLLTFLLGTACST